MRLFSGSPRRLTCWARLKDECASLDLNTANATLPDDQPEGEWLSKCHWGGSVRAELGQWLLVWLCKDAS